MFFVNYVNIQKKMDLKFSKAMCLADVRLQVRLSLKILCFLHFLTVLPLVRVSLLLICIVSFFQVLAVPSAKPLATLLGHTKTVLHCQFTHYGQTLITSSEDCTIRVGKPAPLPSYPFCLHTFVCPHHHSMHHPSIPSVSPLICGV